MKIVFFGTSDFAVSALGALFSSNHKILGVVTAADKAKGRGQKIAFSPVKIFAQKKNLALLQPESLRDERFIQCLKQKAADLFVVAAYGKILAKEILQIPKKFAVNLHSSLLPKYRGAAPINWAIIKGENRTGVTIFKMNEYTDQGEIILQEKTDISGSDSAVNLGERLAKIGARTLLQALDLIKQDKATFTKQDQRQASGAPKLKKEDGLIDWGLSASQIHNRIRGLQPWPGAFTYFNNKLLKIWESKVIEGEKEKMPGEIVDVGKDKGILVQAGKNRLLISVVQLEGKRKMSAAEFILGHSIEIGKRLGK